MIDFSHPKNRYFYKPLTNGDHTNPLRRMMASAVCFAIIAVWHEQMESYSVIAWILVNFCLLNLETVVDTIFNAPSLLSSSSSHLSPQNKARIEALFGSSYLAAAYLSNILFLSNYESVLVIIQKLIYSPLPLTILLLILYTGCHTCKFINKKSNNSRLCRIF